MRKKKHKGREWLRWTARMLAMFFIAFISMFALDVFVEGHSFWIAMFALFMHLIPSFLLLAALIIAWRHELVGGHMFLLLGIIATTFFNVDEIIHFLIVPFPPMLIGLLFIIDYRIRMKKS